MHLFRLSPSRKTLPFTYSADGPWRNGSFRIAALQEPQKGLPPETILHMDAPYIVFFALSADAPEKGAAALLSATVALTTSGDLPSNGGTGRARRSDEGGSRASAPGSGTERSDLRSKSAQPGPRAHANHRLPF